MGSGPAIPLALAGAACLSAGMALQWLGHERSGRRSGRGWKVLGTPLWWAGIVASSVGTLLHYAALSLGALALVQPVEALHIGLTAILMSVLGRERLRARQIVSIALVAVGTAACLAGEADVESGATLSGHGLVLFGAAAAGTGFVSVFLPRGGVGWALFSGVLYSLAAVSWKALVELPWGAAQAVAGLSFAIGYAGGFLALQAGFRRGGAGLLNALATGTATALPMLAAVWIFGERVVPLAWGGLAAILLGVVLLGARQPLRAPAALRSLRGQDLGA